MRVRRVSERRRSFPRTRRNSRAQARAHADRLIARAGRARRRSRPGPRCARRARRRRWRRRPPPAWGSCRPSPCPSAMAARASATVSRAMRVAGSAASRAHAAHRGHRHQRVGAQRGRQLAGGQIGVQVQHLARRRPGPGTTAPAGSRRATAPSSSAVSKPVTSPTRPKSMGSGPPPETTRGGRRRARMTPLPACSPTAARPARPQGRAQLDVQPAGHHHLQHLQRWRRR